MTLGELIAQFADQLGQLWPARVISDWEQGARVRFGGTGRTLTSTNGVRGTGLHLMIPFVDVIHQIDASTEVKLCQRQDLVTEDGVDVSLVLMVRYRVVDAAKMFRTIYEGGDTVVVEVMGSAGELVPTLNSDTIAEEIADVVCKDVEGRLQEWGIQLEEVRVSTCAFPRTFRLIGDAASAAS